MEAEKIEAAVYISEDFCSMGNKYEEIVSKDFAQYLLNNIDVSRVGTDKFQLRCSGRGILEKGTYTLGIIYTSNHIEDIKLWINEKYKQWKQENSTK